MTKDNNRNASHPLDNFIKLHHKSVFKNIASAVVVVDTKGVIKYINKYVEKFFHYHVEELLGKRFLKIVAPAFRKKVSKVFKQLSNGKNIKPYELGFIDKNGEILYAKVSAATLREKGKVIGVLGFATDITEHKKDIEHLSKIIKELSLLYNIGKELTSTINIDLLFSKILIYLSETFGYERVGILMLDEKQKELRIKATTRPFTNRKQNKKIKLGEGITGYVAKTGRPCLINEVSKEKRYLLLDSRTKSEITVPLKLGEKILGVINVESYKANAFDKDDIRTLTLIANQAAIAIENSRLYKSLEESYLDTIKALVSAMEAKDHYTRGHSERVRKYALRIAKVLKLSDRQMRELNYAGYLHDIGKIGIKDTILSKVEPLTDAEFALIKKHPDIGNNILKDVKHLTTTCEIIKSEHERYDGNGYPNGLKKDQIPIGARIIAVADAYDAMTTDRPYRKAISTKKAIQILKKESGKQFDPKVVKAFLKVIKNKK
ncbi:MAG TPA: PAS domain S-box protein [candidate division WOR-3 bacterium]|uniref:PAS domain S-box protein n=1 Tax=candidate division WOR-3 bacterium TaxID=2052148 RepID=A0A9C9ENS5_UNCW3|nr:PAS domain S-box protein [candidate division WOR-3 bacterium]